MPNFTREAIKDSFLKLLNERPVNQITVKDIVEDCGINRNSFYYHFADIPALVEAIITDEADRIIAEYSSFDSIETCFGVAAGFILENKKAIYHIYNSANHNTYERLLLKVCEYVVSTYINNALPNVLPNNSDKEIIIRFYKCECFGQIIEWLNSGMKDDLSVSFKRLFELRKGAIEELLGNGKDKD